MDQNPKNQNDCEVCHQSFNRSMPNRICKPIARAFMERTGPLIDR